MTSGPEQLLTRFPEGIQPAISTALETARLMDLNAKKAGQTHRHHAALSSLLLTTDLDQASARDIGPIEPRHLGIHIPANLPSPTTSKGGIDVRHAVNEFTGEETISLRSGVSGENTTPALEREALGAVIRSAAVTEKWPLVSPLMGLLMIKSKAEERSAGLINTKHEHVLYAGLRTDGSQIDERTYWEGRILGNERTYGILQHGNIIGKVEPHISRALKELHGDDVDQELAGLLWKLMIGSQFSTSVTGDKMPGLNVKYKAAVIEDLMFSQMEGATARTRQLATAFPRAFQDFHLAQLDARLAGFV